MVDGRLESEEFAAGGSHTRPDAYSEQMKADMIHSAVNGQIMGMLKTKEVELSNAKANCQKYKEMNN